MHSEISKYGRVPFAMRPRPWGAGGWMTGAAAAPPSLGSVLKALRHRTLVESAWLLVALAAVVGLVYGTSRLCYARLRLLIVDGDLVRVTPLRVRRYERGVVSQAVYVDVQVGERYAERILLRDRAGRVVGALEW